MCTATLTHFDNYLARSCPIDTAVSPFTDGEDLFDHLSHCADCLLTIAQQRKPLSVGGCSRFRQLLAGACPLFDSIESPLRAVHLSPETIEAYYYRRLMPVEKVIFDAHVRRCSHCAAELHNELLFLHAVKAALSEDVSGYRDRGGATFAVGAPV